MWCHPHPPPPPPPPNPHKAGPAWPRQRAQKERARGPALACPCLGDLKEGPCGPSFVYAFGCFMRSEHEDKGMDCLAEFAAFQVRRTGGNNRADRARPVRSCTRGCLAGKPVMLCCR